MKNAACYATIGVTSAGLGAGGYINARCRCCTPKPRVSAKTITTTTVAVTCEALPYEHEERDENVP